MDYLSTSRKTTLLPVEKDRLLGAGGNIFVLPHIWQLPILSLYIQRTTFSWMDDDDVDCLTVTGLLLFNARRTLES